MIEVRRVIAMLVVPFVVGLTCLYTTDCKPLPEPGITVTVAQKRAFAEGTYGAELLRCVDNNTTVKTIDACADDVRRRWPRGVGADGGASATVETQKWNGDQYK